MGRADWPVLVGLGADWVELNGVGVQMMEPEIGRK